jgi:hypothetical protein
LHSLYTSHCPLEPYEVITADGIVYQSRTNGLEVSNLSFCLYYQEFWVTWSNGSVKVGKGLIENQNELDSWSLYLNPVRLILIETHSHYDKLAPQTWMAERVGIYQTGTKVLNNPIYLQYLLRYPFGIFKLFFKYIYKVLFKEIKLKASSHIMLVTETQ